MSKVHARPPSPPPPPPSPVATAERVSIFDKSKSHYHNMCVRARVRDDVCHTPCRKYIYILCTSYPTRRDWEGVACRTTVFGQHTTLRYNIMCAYRYYNNILYCCCAACAGTGRRYNDNSYCCILYTPAGPIVLQRVRRGSRCVVGRSDGRSARHTWTIVTRRRRRRRPL